MRRWWFFNGIMFPEVFNDAVEDAFAFHDELIALLEVRFVNFNTILGEHHGMR